MDAPEGCCLEPPSAAGLAARDESTTGQLWYLTFFSKSFIEIEALKRIIYPFFLNSGGSQASHVFSKCSAADPHPQQLSYSGHLQLYPKQRRLCSEAASNHIGSVCFVYQRQKEREGVQQKHFDCFPISECVVK